MGYLSKTDIAELEETLCNRQNKILVKKTKNCCEITGHTVAAILIFSLNVFTDLFNSILCYLLGGFLFVRESLLRVNS